LNTASRPTPSKRYFVFTGFYLDTIECRLIGAENKPVSLNSRAFDVLHYLVQHSGEIIDKGTLMAAVWPNTIVEENNLNQAIAAVRKALGENPDHHRFILTIPGRGYRFIPEVSTLSTIPVTHVPAEPAPVAEKETSNVSIYRRPRLVWVAGALLIGFVATAAIYVFREITPSEPLPVEKQAPAVSAHPPQVAQPEKSVTVVGAHLQSVAVLPFTDMSPDKDQEYFADGVAEEVLNQLSRIHDLFVVGRTSSFFFKGKNEDLRVIGEKLGVSNILEGSVRKAGNRVRISTQLIKAVDGYHLWSETYDRTMEDIFAVQDEIARSVADALQVTLRVGDLSGTPGMTRNVEAYESFLAGRALLYTLNRENVSQAIERLEQAVALDPDFAVGWNALRVAYNYAAVGWIPNRTEEFVAKRHSASARVIELVPEADYALRLKAYQSGDWVEVERLWKQALALNPADADTNIGYGDFVFFLGRPTEAIDYFQRTVRVEPLASTPHLMLGITNESRSNLDGALTEYKQARELSGQGAIPLLCLLVLALEEHDRARIDEYAPLVMNSDLFGNIDRTETRDINEVMHTLLDTPEQARTELGQISAAPAYADPLSQSVLAVWASYFGEHELALQAFQKANAFNAFVAYAIFRPIHKPMRHLPGFKDLVTKLGLVDYWRATGNWGEFCRPVGEDDFECE